MGLLDWVFPKVNKRRANKAAKSGDPLVRFVYDWDEVRAYAADQVANLFDPQYSDMSGEAKRKQATAAVAKFLDDGLVWRADILGSIGEYLDGKVARALLYAIAAANVQDMFKSLSCVPRENHQEAIRTLRFRF